LPTAQWSQQCNARSCTSLQSLAPLPTTPIETTAGTVTADASTASPSIKPSVRICKENGPFLSAFPVVVPSLSWQNDHFERKGTLMKQISWSYLVLQTSELPTCQRHWDHSDLLKRISFCEVSLCLSRACLGKMIIFGIESMAPLG
jgi:hypothetical protein